MNSRISLIGVMALALVCWAGSAQAATVFSDNFEGYADVASSYPAATDNNPGAPWAVIEDQVSRVQVMANPATGAFSTPFGNQYLHFANTSGDDEADVQLTAPQQAAIAAQGNMHVDFDAYNVSGAKNFGISAFDSASGVYAGRVFDVSLRASGALWTYQGVGDANEVRIDNAYTLDNWHHYAVDVNFQTDLWSVAVDGTTIASDLAFEGGDLSQVQVLTFGGTGSGSHGGMDNLVITTGQVPEPAAIVLLLTGLIGLLAYAWRNRK
jgi:hypothetical protein